MSKNVQFLIWEYLKSSQTVSNLIHSSHPPTLLDVLLHFSTGLHHPDLREDKGATLGCRCGHLGGALGKQPPLVAFRKLVGSWAERGDLQLGILAICSADGDLAGDDGTTIGQGLQGRSCSPQSRLGSRFEVGAVMQEGSHYSVWREKPFIMSFQMRRIYKCNKVLNIF